MLILSLQPWPQIIRMPFCNHVAGLPHHWISGAERAAQVLPSGWGAAIGPFEGDPLARRSFLVS